jgi:hypothetical protein
MKYIITESKLEQVIIKYLNKFYGNLEEYRTDLHPERLFFVRGKKVLMELNIENMRLEVDYDTIWEDLETVFSIDYDDVENIIKKWVEETYNLRGVRPERSVRSKPNRWKRLMKDL